MTYNLQRAAPIPANEASRLNALRRYDILDTPSEAEFDDFTRLAAQLCGTPVAQITLVDTDRQWFKSNFGVDVAQVPRDIGFCAHTILGSAVFEVPNMLDDERFRDNPFVTGPPDVRFYAGAPLLSPDGFNVGALCVLDITARTLTNDQRESLAALGRQVMRLMESRVAGRKERALNAGLRASEVRNQQLNAQLERLVADRTAALDASEERFRQFAEQSSEAFWFIDVNPQRVLYVSPAMVTIFGLPEEWFYSDPLTWLEIIHPDDLVRVAPVWRAALGHRSARFDIECRSVRPDGRIRWVTVSGTPIQNDAGEIVRIGGMVKDITKAKELQSQLVQSQKIEGVGQLAGGIAHDFNNLLTVINGTAAMAAEGLVDGDSMLADLHEIGRAGLRAAGLTRQLLAFSRKQVLQPIVFSPNVVVADMMSMLRRLIGANIDLRCDAAADLACIRADYGQTEQVVLNLIVNARDAMAAGGTITITTQNIVVVDGRAPCPPGRYVLLQVTDTGSGMDEATRARIFEPFFTTKEAGKGTGLGLSTVYGIVEQSGGKIDVSSVIGCGTTFSIYFPRVDEPAHDRRPARGAPSVRGAERVLLVEDDAPLCRLTARVLQATGYTVMVAANGAEALAVLDADVTPFHLVLADVVIPGITAGDLTAAIRGHHPKTRVLFMSGYSDDTVGRQGVLHEGAHFLAKPFSTTALKVKVRAVLDAKR